MLAYDIFSLILAPVFDFQLIDRITNNFTNENTQYFYKILYQFSFWLIRCLK